MSGLLDGPLRDIASSLVGALVNDSITVTRTTGGENPLTGAVSTSAATYTFKAAPPAPYTSREIDGTAIRAGDAKLVVPGANIPAAMGAFDPKTDRIVLPSGSESWGIVKADVVTAGTLAVVVVLQLRR